MIAISASIAEGFQNSKLYQVQFSTNTCNSGSIVHILFNFPVTQLQRTAVLTHQQLTPQRHKRKCNISSNGEIGLSTIFLYISANVC